MVTCVSLQGEMGRDRGKWEKSLNWNLGDKQNSSEWYFVALCMLSLLFPFVLKIKAWIFFASFAASKSSQRMSEDKFKILKRSSSCHNISWHCSVISIWDEINLQIIPTGWMIRKDVRKTFSAWFFAFSMATLWTSLPKATTTC